MAKHGEPTAARCKSEASSSSKGWVPSLPSSRKTSLREVPDSSNPVENVDGQGELRTVSERNWSGESRGDWDDMRHEEGVKEESSADSDVNDDVAAAPANNRTGRTDRQFGQFNSNWPN
eukprot:8596571-Karenia_brevis.AAC.2